MPHVSGNKAYNRNKSSGGESSQSRNATIRHAPQGYDPKDDGYDSDQAEEIRAWNDWEAAEERFFEELSEAE